MEWIPYIAITIYIIFIILILFLGIRSKKTPQTQPVNKKNHFLIRFFGVYVFIALCFGGIIYKITDLQFVKGDKLRKFAEESISTPDTIRAHRGNIFSCEGILLSSSIPYYRPGIDMRVENYRKNNFFDNNVKKLADTLAVKFPNKSAREYERELRKNFRAKKGDYHFLGKSYHPYLEFHKNIKTLPILEKGATKGGITIDTIEQRVRPYGGLCKRTIGQLNKNTGKGKAGLEREYENILSGEYGLEIQKTKGGRNTGIRLKEPIDGCDIISTISIPLQEVAEKELRKQLELTQAQRGAVILMETKTGKIRAIVNLDKISNGNYAEIENLAMNSQIEPGSTFKTLSILVAMEDGYITDSTKVDTEDGSCKFADRTMKDHNYRGKGNGGFGVASIATIMHQSSNVGVSKVIHKYYGNNPQTFIDGIKRTGITDSMHIEIPGFGKPFIKDTDHDQWSKVSLPWMSIGYEVQMPPIYTLIFYNAIANNGCMVEPLLTEAIVKNGETIKKSETRVVKEKICSEQTLKYIQGILEGVVTKGTAKAIRSDYVAIAGKTGTSQIQEHGTNRNKEGKKRHQITFCGYFPADNPKYSCIVYVRDNKKGGAGSVCGPVFKALAEKAYVLDNYGHNDSLKLSRDWSLEKITKQDNSDNLHNIENSLNEGVMPDLTGFNAQEIIVLLENNGFNVKIDGYGKVINQSIEPDKPLTPRDKNIRLTLR